MASSRARVTGLIWCTVVFAVAMVLLFATQAKPILPTLTPDHALASVLFFDRFILDFLIFLLIGGLLINGGPVRRVLAYLWLAMFYAAYLAQLNAVYIGGEFVTILAVDNIGHVSLLVNRNSVAATVIVIAIYAFAVLLLERGFRQRWRWAGMTIFTAVVLAAAAAVHQHRLWLPDHLLELRDGYYASKDNRLDHRSPVESLYKVLFRGDRDGLKPLDSREIARASEEFGININPGQQFPLVKAQVYSTPPPFGVVHNPTPQPNIIVFMAEGLSARTLNVYGNLFPELTPNLVDFASQAMVVENYFNHTYATYRGLHGQFCSIFPTHGGIGGWHDRFEEVKRINYLCLSDIFNQQGYRTVFLDTHRADHGRVDEMAAEIGFREVLTAEIMVEETLHEEPLRRDALSDQQLFDGLIGKLESMRLDDDRRPFFLSLYNLETHAFQKIRDDGKSYDHGDSYVLDSIHNFDHAFGRFWEYFQDSPYYENTVVVFTTDHAHYPDRDFVSMMKGDPDYRPYFVDRIPLMIYDPLRSLPASYDANFASSIDFAPGMVHYFGLENRSNPFVGNSLFERTHIANPASIGSADFEHYLITPQGVEMSSREGVNPPQLEFAGYVVDTIRQLEQHDRIWFADVP